MELNHQQQNSEDNEIFEDFEDFEDLGFEDFEDSEDLNLKKRRVSFVRDFPEGCGPEPGFPGFDDDILQAKKRFSFIRDYPDGCGPEPATGFPGYVNDPNVEEEEPEYLDWYDLIDFEEDEEGPSSNPVGGGSGKEVVLGLEMEVQESGRKSGGGGEIVMALMAPKFCPWRDSQGKLKKTTARSKAKKLTTLSVPK